MSEVKIVYSDYGDSPVAEEIEFELIEDIALKLKCDQENKVVYISMADMITANTELEGTLEYTKLNTLIKTLSQLRNQLKTSGG